MSEPYSLPNCGSNISEIWIGKIAIVLYPDPEAWGEGGLKTLKAVGNT